ncbi:type I-B CRISPR-associated protein Cas7/Csh2 [Halobellus salinus]|uniref:Type I-B CRISPR-associated protein Cas7/Csh2 n=1 Tax=Halobellus salinus TaxID=931585 RepID=A0A830ECM4_9EURY|nr:type I-B CRISPR-associated protein Cas7/Csh2 [Halobellus salinus]GGI97208.1 type I-B CRISPR-associated protein Cas7/Csh2 [Halobellus salinus]SMP33621.1 CRISPR-associated protein, Csh2 family [Halobellus salinus]
MSEHYPTASNRSEIIFAYDAVDANPNGNPLSGANRPRIDPQTDQAIVTDVRLKRYLRDQLQDDGHGVYIRNVKEEGEQATREDLLEDRLKEIELDELDEDEIEAAVFQQFLENSADVRYFGATMSVDMDEEKYGDIAAELPDHFRGPVQFSPGKSLHPVTENEEYNSLTSVIATGEGKEQGGFDLDDHRIQYAFIGFHGLVDEHGAEDTLLTDDDVRRLDTLCWRALKNQTISRSKVGQEPRFYLRVEYDGESFHLGGLDQDLTLDTDASEPAEELRTIRDVCIDATGLVDRLKRASDRIDTVHVVASDVLNVSIEGEIGNHEFLYSELRNALGDDSVRVVDVYEDATATRPEE